MKISHLPRIYADTKLGERILLNFEKDYYHYLKIVLRLKVDDCFRIFNEIDGEFIGQITNITKNSISVLLINLFRVVEKEPKLTLGLSVIKNDRMLDAISMAVQLGVTTITPLITDRSQFHKINSEKIKKYIIESTQQSERITPPNLLPLLSLNDFLKQNSSDLTLYANENEITNKSLLTIKLIPCSNIAVIVGPEGGFSENELSVLAVSNNCISFSLGHNVLRTETAVAACLAQVTLLR